MYCKNCGKELQESVKFCAVCGTPVEVGNTAPANQPVSEPEQNVTIAVPRKSKSLKIALIIAIIVIVLFGIFMVLEATGVTEFTGWFNNDSVETTVEDDEEEKEEKSDKEEEKEEEEEVPPASEDEVAVAEYVESVRAEVEATSNDTLSAVVEARGTSVVYEYHYKVDVPSETVDELTAILDSEDIVELYKALLSNIQTEEPAITSIIIEYYGNDGSLLYSNEY